MIIKILGYKGNSYIRYTCDFLLHEFNRIAPVVVIYFHPDYYYHVKEQVMKANLDVVLANFYFYFAPWVGIETRTKELYRLFWQKAKDVTGRISIKTLVIMDAHTMNGEAMDFVKNVVNAQTLILAGDPNYSQYAENFGENYLKSLEGKIIDVIHYFPFPRYIHHEIMQLLPQMLLDGVKPYIPEWAPLDINGEILKSKGEGYLKALKGKTLIVANKIKPIAENLFRKDIPFRRLRVEPLFSIPVQLFKMVDTLDALVNETRLLTSDEIIRIIHLTGGEITEKFGGRQYLVELFHCANTFKPKAVSCSDFFKTVLEYYKRDKIELLITPLQRQYYAKWKHRLRNMKWIDPDIVIAYPWEVKGGEYDTVITEKLPPLFMWRILGRCRERLVYL